jgi:hypothetical protein
VTTSRSLNHSQPRRGWALLVYNLLLACMAMLLALLFSEVLLRLLGVDYPVFVWTDPVRGVAHIPGAKGGKTLPGGHRWVEINSDGWRGPDVEVEHPPGTLRIALLGDSFIEAFEVPFDSTVGEVVERRLTALRGSPVEVLNFGNGGYGTTQEFLTLQHEVWKYSPDLILLAVTTGNDISDNYRPLRQGDYVPYQVYQGDRLVLDTSFVQARGYRSRALWTRRMLDVVTHFRLAQLVNRARHLRRKGERQEANASADQGDELGLRDEVQMPPTTPEWQEAWKVTEGVLRLMRDDCRSRHTPFALVTLTRGIQVTPVGEEKERFLRQLGAKDLYYPERRLSEFGRQEGIPVLNLAPSMAEEAERRHVYFHAHGKDLGVGHWNVAGHRAAGERIAAWLADELAHDSTMTVRR